MDAASLAADLIRAAGDGPDAVIERVAGRLAGFDHRATPGEPSAHLFTRGAPRLALSGHVDVVPAGGGWTRDPHGGEVADARVWGRGACDMLGSVACFVTAASLSSAPCAILLTTDEETTMAAATRAIEAGFLAGIEGVVVGEPTAMDVGIAEKGVLWTRIEASGRTAHGSMPELGDNAAMRLMGIVSRLAPPPGHHALLGKPTVSVNRLGGGEAVNQVPAEAWAEVDLRYLPGMVEAEAVRALEAALDPGRSRVRVLSSHVPFEVPGDAPLVRAALAASGGRAIGLPYGTEASKFAPAGIPTVILGPGEPGLAHTARESIRLADLEAGVRCYRTLLERSA